MAAMGYGRRYLESQGKMLGIARDLSLPLYVLYYAPLTATTYLLLKAACPSGSDGFSRSQHHGSSLRCSLTWRDTSHRSGASSAYGRALPH